ncbi:DNA polymerase III subunit chi [Alphaproteobacteria bacterium]|nr:DNA polymerase III subunit chi [Alphaproteobacteria bacterium]
MSKIDFYHLSLSDVETVLLMLLKKTLAAGKKALILCPQPAASALDTDLWAHEPDSWLAHGLDDADGKNIAKIWISTDMTSNPIEAEFVFLLHGSVPDDLSKFERVFNLFDGRSEAQVQQARDQWKSWGDLASADRGYFAETDNGRWEKKA